MVIGLMFNVSKLEPEKKEQTNGLECETIPNWSHFDNEPSENCSLQSKTNIKQL